MIHLGRFNLGLTVAVIVGAALLLIFQKDSFAEDNAAVMASEVTSPEISNLWKAVAPDLWSAQVTLPGGAIFSSELLAFRSTLSNFSVAILKASEIGMQRSTVRYLADSAGAVVAVNGSFFDEYGKPLGLIVSRGIVAQSIQRRSNTLTSVFAIVGGKPRIMSRSDFDVAGVTSALQAGPRLLSKGEKVSGLAERDAVTRRSGLCLDRQGALVLYATSSRLRGVSLRQLQDVLINSFECVDALNLDGGGSSQMFFRGFSSSGIESISLDGQDLVPNAIGLVSNQ